MGALHFVEVWLQVRRLMAETELGLLSLGSEQIGGEHVQFAWPLIVSFWVSSILVAVCCRLMRY